MVGLFSRLSISKARHRRTQSALDQREVFPPSTEASTGATTASTVTNGIEVAVQFKPVERPTEPLDNDQPINCPLREPSILNDGRIWKERVSSSIQRQEQTALASQSVNTRPPSNRLILPSISAPEHSILKLLEDCNASGI